MYNSNTETHLDNAFAMGAKRMFNSMKDKAYEYKLYKQVGLLNTELCAEGLCVVTNITYNRSEDCNFYNIRDLNTNKNITINEFLIDLKQILS